MVEGNCAASFRFARRYCRQEAGGRKFVKESLKYEGAVRHLGGVVKGLTLGECCAANRSLYNRGWWVTPVNSRVLRGKRAPV